DVRAVLLEAVRIARVHGDRRAVAALDRRGVGKTVAGVDPAVEAEAELAGPTVRVSVSVHLPQGLAFIRVAFALGVQQALDIWDAVNDGPSADRQDADGDVEAVGKRGHLAGPAVGAEVLEDLDCVPRPRWVLGRVRVFHRPGDPESAACVEGDVDRL